MIFAKCAACGRNSAKTWYNGKLFCDECIASFGTCKMCKYGQRCEFKTNLAPIPHFVTKVARKETSVGYMEQIIQVPNPQRAKAFCLEGECKCLEKFDEKYNCMRQFGTCKNYLEHEF